MGELALTEEIKTLGLEKYAEELERDGLTIVPPEVNGFGMDRIDEIVELILARAREMTGCTFTLDGGPQQELEFPPMKREFTPHRRERRSLRGDHSHDLIAEGESMADTKVESKLRESKRYQISLPDRVARLGHSGTALNP